MSFFSGTSLAYTVHIIIACVLTMQILLDNKIPQSSIAWILALFLFPYVGSAFYLLSGVNWKKRKIVKQRPEELFGKYLEPALGQQQNYIQEEYARLDSDIVKTLQMNLRSSNALITVNNKTEIFHSGKLFFHEFLNDLRNAEESIHLEYFIYRDDEVGEEILRILRKKIREGVEVRLLVDGFGSMFSLSQRGRRKLIEAGVDFRNYLNPASILGAWVINYRNHRKIVVVDGKIAYTGGMNIGEEYISGGRRFKTWRDTHMRFTGEVVSLFQSIFLADWINSNGKVQNLEKYFSLQEMEDQNAFLPVQVLCSGPDSSWYSIQQLYFNIVSNADSKVLIQSPYFVPDDSIRIAMETAALSGVDVRLMMTGIPDKKIPFWAAHTYFEQLLSAGVKIYLYEKGFFHSKVVSVDDLIVTSGSCNMDVRSFFLDYEINTVFYDEAAAENFSKQFEKDMEGCMEMTLELYRKFRIPVKLRNSVCRIFSPLL